MTDARPPRESISAIGMTALGMARVRAAESAREDRLFEDPFAAELVAAARQDAAPNGSETRPGDGRADVLEGGGHVRGPWLAILNGAVVRTRFFDDYLLEATRSGCRQVVLLAAGLDMRAFRLAWPGDVRLFELDLPDVLAFKQRVIAQRGYTPACERVVVDADLRDDWRTPLLQASLDPGKATAWLAEGLLIYLMETEKDRLLRTVSALSVPGSQIAFDHLSQSRLEHLRASVGSLEQGRWAPSLWRSGLDEDPARWLARQGWDARVHDSEEVAGLYGRRIAAAGDRAVAGASWLVRAVRRAGES